MEEITKIRRVLPAFAQIKGTKLDRVGGAEYRLEFRRKGEKVGTAREVTAAAFGRIQKRLASKLAGSGKLVAMGQSYDGVHFNFWLAKTSSQQSGGGHHG